MKRLFFSLHVLLFCVISLFSMKTACLNSSISDLWSLAGGSVDITVRDSVERGFADESAILVDGKSGRNINTEILIASKPDLVLGSVDTSSHVKLKSLMDEKKIEIMLIKEDSFSDFLSAFKSLTEITGRYDLYEEYGVGQKEEIERIIESSAAYPDKPRVLFIRAGSAFNYVKAKRADDHFGAKIIEDLGAINIADEYNALTDSLSLELILSARIDKILIVPQGDEAASKEYINSLFSLPGWKSVKAIKEKNVYFLSKDLFHYKPNGRWSEAYSTMLEVLYEK